jgi:hypothetical protein
VEAPASRSQGERSAGTTRRAAAGKRRCLEVVEPPVSDRVSEPVLFREAEKWLLFVPCGECGGHRLGLDAAGERLARVRAESFLSYARDRFCLGCQSNAWRGDPFRPFDGDSALWWDTFSEEWMGWHPFPGSDGGVSLPLGVHSFWEQASAAAAARALHEAPLPLRIGGVDGQVSRAFYDADEGRWKLWAHCHDCGGVELPLAGRGRGRVDSATTQAVRCLELIVDEGCPRCAPGEDAHPHMRIWFDTAAGEWMLWQPLHGSSDGVTFPLGVDRFDTDREVLELTARTLLFEPPAPL